KAAKDTACSPPQFEVPSLFSTSGLSSKSLPAYMFLTSAQCTPHLPHKPNPPSPPRPHVLLLRLGARLPWRRPVQIPRRRDTRCRSPRETSRWARVPHGSYTRDV